MCQKNEDKKAVFCSVFIGCALVGVLIWVCLPVKTDPGSMFKGINSYYLYTCSDEYQVQVFQAMKAGSFTHVRVFLNKYIDEGYPGDCGGFDDVESPIGVFNEATLSRVGQFFLRAKDHGIKIVLSLHDRWSLGCWRKDVYTTAFNLSVADVWGKDCPNPIEFYQSTVIKNALKNRIWKLMTTFISNTGVQWKDFDAIDIIEVQNEPQYGSIIQSLTWDCEMASYLRQFTSAKISNGASFVPNSLTCSPINVHSIHDYNSLLSFIAQWEYTKQFGNGMVLLEEFEYDESKIRWANSHSIPWMFWNVDERNTSTSISVKRLSTL